MTYCTKCGAKLPAGATFCPSCGHPVKVKTSAQKQKTTSIPNNSSRVKKVVARISKKSLRRWLIGIVAVLTVCFFGYRLLYLPNVVKSAVNVNRLNESGYTATANTMKKTVIIKADQTKLDRLAGALEENDYDKTTIGAEEQLAALEKALPGNWTVQIEQHKLREEQTILWQYKGSRETIRFQNSDECKQTHKQLVAAKAKKKADDDAFNNTVSAGLLGGAVGALLSR